MRSVLIFIALFIISCNHPEIEEYSRENNNYKTSGENEISNSTSISDIKTIVTDPSISYKVVGITDGDTYKLLHNNMQFIIRSAHINCPEKNQPYGQKAKQFASDMCFGKYVTLRHNNKYHRDRLIAEVILEDGRNLNKLLVENGLAWHYKRFSKDKEYAELENVARQNRIGLWIDPNPIDPDEWRHR